MSKVTVTDKRGGLFLVNIDFTYGECERLPFNILRRVNAKLQILPRSGLSASAEFNIRNQTEAANFLELLDQFGETGSFVHGSAASSTALELVAPPGVDPESKSAPSAGEEDDGLEIDDANGKHG